VVLVSSKIALPLQTSWAGLPQEAADWAGLLDRGSNSKSASAPKAAALAAVALAAAVVVAVWERQRQVAL
jgi:hypothetical protein